MLVDPNNRASWVQSIGSISAIMLSILIATFQTERNLEQAQQLRQQEKESEIQNLLDIVLYMYHLLERIQQDKTPEIGKNPTFISNLVPPERQVSVEQLIEFAEALKKNNAIKDEEFIKYTKRCSAIGKLYFYLADIKRLLETGRNFPISKYPNKICIEYAFNYYRLVNQFLKQIEEYIKMPISDELAGSSAEYKGSNETTLGRLQKILTVITYNGRRIIDCFMEEIKPNYDTLKKELEKHITTPPIPNQNKKEETKESPTDTNTQS